MKCKDDGLRCDRGKGRDADIIRTRSPIAKLVAIIKADEAMLFLLSARQPLVASSRSKSQSAADVFKV